jgi:hypothetical protein
MTMTTTTTMMMRMMIVMVMVMMMTYRITLSNIVWRNYVMTSHRDVTGMMGIVYKGNNLDSSQILAICKELFSSWRFSELF